MPHSAAMAELVLVAGQSRTALSGDVLCPGATISRQSIGQDASGGQSRWWQPVLASIAVYVHV